MNKTGQIVFIVFILVYMIFWGFIVYTGIPREQRRKSKYDERQRIEQGRAFQYAHIALLFYLILCLFVDQIFHVVWCDPVFGLFLGITLSASVFLAYCIFQDAYFRVGESKPGALITMNVVGFSQLLIGLDTLSEGKLLQNGIVTKHAIHLLLFFLVLVFDVLILIRRHLDHHSS